MRVEKINTKPSTNFGIMMELGQNLTAAKASGEISGNVLDQITQYGDSLSKLDGDNKVVLDFEFARGLGAYFVKEAPSEPNRIGRMPFSRYHIGTSAASAGEFLQKAIPLKWLLSFGSDLVRHFR